MDSTTIPQIVLHHADGSDDWRVTLDCGKTIKLRTADLTSNKRFRMAAVMQAQRLFPEMTDSEWLSVVADACAVLAVTPRRD